MSKVFCSDCEYCKAVNRENTSAKCQHPNNVVDENWHSIAAKDTCAFINKNNNCNWFSSKKISDLRRSNNIINDIYEI